MPYHHLCLRGLGGSWHCRAPRREVVLAVDGPASRQRVLRHVLTAGGAVGWWRRGRRRGVGRSSWCCSCSSSTRWLTFSCSSSSSSPGCARAVHRQSAGHFSCAQRGTHSANCAEDCSWRRRPCDQQRHFPQSRGSNPQPQIQFIL